MQVKLLTPTEVLDGLLFRMIYHIFYCVKNSFELPVTIIYTNIRWLVFDTIFPEKNNMAGNELVSAWKLDDEAQGILLMKVLEDEGILSELRSEQIPWMNGIMKAARGYWGDLMVLERDKIKTDEIIQSYLGEIDID